MRSMQTRSLGHPCLPGHCWLQLCSMLRDLQTEANARTATKPPLIVTRTLDSQCSLMRKLRVLRSPTA